MNMIKGIFVAAFTLFAVSANAQHNTVDFTIQVDDKNMENVQIAPAEAAEYVKANNLLNTTNANNVIVAPSPNIANKIQQSASKVNQPVAMKEADNRKTIPVATEPANK